MKPLNLTPTEYHALPFHKQALPDLTKAGYISASILAKARKPLHMMLLPEQKDTSEMQWGSLIDCLWTTPKEFNTQYVVLPDDAPKKPSSAQLKAKKPAPDTVAAIEWWKAFESISKGKICITAPELDEAHRAVAMLEDHPLAVAIHRESDKQVALVGDSPFIPSTKAKCLIDLLPMSGPFQDAIPDLKTTNSLETHNLISIAHRFDYPVKLAYYGVLAEAAGFGPRPRGVIIWQCSEYPFEVLVREIDPADMARARAAIHPRLHQLACIHANDLKRLYDTELSITTMPEWAKPR